MSPQGRPNCWSANIPRGDADAIRRPPPLVSLPTLRWTLSCPLWKLADCMPALSSIAIRETKADRATRAMLKIVRRLNPDDPDPCNDLPKKPPRMHWTTYDRLVERYEGHSEKW